MAGGVLGRTADPRGAAAEVDDTAGFDAEQLIQRGGGVEVFLLLTIRPCLRVVTERQLRRRRHDDLDAVWTTRGKELETSLTRAMSGDGHLGAIDTLDRHHRRIR